MTADAVGGVWTFALELIAALATEAVAEDVSVTLAVMGGGLSDAQRDEASGSAAEAVHETDLALEWMSDPWKEVDQAGDWLLGLAERVRPDVVHLNGYAHAQLPWPAPTLVVGHSCVLSWWAAVKGEPAPARWDEYRRRVAAGLAAADAVVAPTAAMLDELGRWYGARGGQVIANCRRTGWVVKAAKEPIVVGAGRLWDDAKNLAALDRAAAHLAWPVVLAGDPVHPEGSTRATGAAHAAGALPFAELAALLGRASVFALPARYEPFGLVALEAAMSGCARVLGDIPSLREVWGDAATYVHPDDDDGLLAVLGELLSTPGLASARGAAARRHAARYQPAATASAYLAAYRTLRVRARAAGSRVAG